MNKPFFPPRSRFLLGLIVLLASVLLSVGRWYATNGPLETLAWVEQHRSPGDSAAYSSALYHGSHARAVHDARWRVSGYATQGIAGALVGVALLLSGRSRRT